MAGECPDAIPARELGDHCSFGYLAVDDVDEYYRPVVAARAEIGKMLRDEPWGMREFGLRAADGHRVMIGSQRHEAGSGGGLARAFRELLGLSDGQLVIPEHHSSMGAIGVVYHLLQTMPAEARARGTI